MGSIEISSSMFQKNTCRKGPEPASELSAFFLEQVLGPLLSPRSPSSHLLNLLSPNSSLDCKTLAHHQLTVWLW